MVMTVDRTMAGYEARQGMDRNEVVLECENPGEDANDCEDHNGEPFHNCDSSETSGSMNDGLSSANSPTTIGSPPEPTPRRPSLLGSSATTPSGSLNARLHAAGCQGDPLPSHQAVSRMTMCRGWWEPGHNSIFRTEDRHRCGDTISKPLRIHCRKASMPKLGCVEGFQERERDGA
jgi:hypothetical protein